jgi:hypothetical protein
MVGIDPAVAAWQKVRKARTNDVEYLEAIVEFERAVPTTERGVNLKRKLERSRKRALAEGDVLTWRGCVHQARYAKTIEEGLRRLTAGVPYEQEEGDANGPAPTLRPPRVRRSPKAAK